MITKMVYGTLKKVVYNLNQADIETAIIDCCKKTNSWLAGNKVNLEFTKDEEGKIICEVTQEVLTDVKESTSL